MDTMKDIMLACIILHIMIVTDKQDTFSGNVNIDYDCVDHDILNAEISCGTLPNFVTCKQNVLYEFINNFKLCIFL